MRLYNGTVNSQRPANLLGHALSARFIHEPLVFGALCGLASAIGYTAANICLRTVSHYDPVWVSAVKAAPTILLFGPWLFTVWRRGQLEFPGWRIIAALTTVAVIGQLFGNVVFQWSLGIVGIAMVVPLTLGAMIVAGALLGRLMLAESVTVRMALASLVLIIAICVLSLGAGNASAHIVTPGTSVTTLLVVAGVAAACLSGVSYALLGVVIRQSVTGKMHVAMSLVVVTLVGVVTLGPFAYLRVGWTGMISTPPGAFAIMLLAGFFNAVAFLALTKALQLIPVVYVNALNATQATMAAVAGVLLFREPPSLALWIGVGLTVIGLLTMQRRRSAKD